MKIALIGDSTTEGYGLSAENSLAQTLAPMLTGHTIGNFGRSGYTAYDLMNTSTAYEVGTLDSPITYTATPWNAAKSWNPDVVVLSIGINDGQRYYLSPTTYANLAPNLYRDRVETIASDCDSLGIRLIVWNGAWFPYGGDYSAQTYRSPIIRYLDLMTTITAGYGFELADTRTPFKAAVDASTPNLMLDDFHQDVAGQAIIADAIADRILAAPYDLDVNLGFVPSTTTRRRQRIALGGV